MALSVPSSNVHAVVGHGLASPAASKRSGLGCSTRRCSTANLVVICSSGSNKQQQKRRKSGSATSSPLQAAEELAARFGLEMAVAGLDRLYRELDGDAPPAFPGPGWPGRPLRVAYQGVRGSYCQEAASAAFPSSAASENSGRFSFLPCSHMEGAFAMLEDGSADRAVVPLENSLDGPISRNLDLLLRHPCVRIVGELLLPVDHCLLALPGASSSALRRVVSHPQALAHCRQRLGRLGLEVEEVANAACAAEVVAEEGIRDTAVIGSKMAAREFRLRVLERNFQDQPAAANVNRFLQLATGGEGHGRKTKTTVAFSLANGPSELFRALWAFESRGVRVSRVDHRPNRANPVRIVEKAAYMDYVFFLDLEGPESDHWVKSGIASLHEFAWLVRVLGSYGCTCRTL